MTISIITATYNSEKHLASAIASLQSQTVFEYVEHIAVDGASKDSTIQIYQVQSPQSKLVSEPDKGLYDALNKGVNRASGDIIGFLHADDVLARKDVLASVLKIFQENPTVDAVYGDLLYKDADLNTTKRRWKSGQPQKMSTGWMPPHPATFVRKSVFDTIGGFKTNIGSAADYEWLSRANHIHKTKLYYIPKVLVHMRTGGMSNANLAARNQGLKGDLMAWKINTGYANYWVVLLKKLRKIPQYLFN